MKKKLKSAIVLVLTALVSLFVFAGCSFKQTREDIRQEHNLTAAVQYYANGGKFDNNLDTKTLDCVDGQIALDIGNVKANSNNPGIERDGYDFDGWYYAVLDSDGNPVFEDEEKNIVQLGEKVDFSKRLQSGDHWIVGAKWSLTSRLNIVLACDEGAVVPNGDEEAEIKSFVSGDTLKSLKYNSNGKLSRPASEPIEVKDSAYTFLEYYEDAACEVVVDWKNIEKGETDKTVYAKYIEGDWTVVKTPSDLGLMLTACGEGKRYWIFNDIDASSITTGVPITTFGAEVRGNGHTIRNLTMNKLTIRTDAPVAMFGNITDSAKITDLTFENVTLNYKSNADKANLYFVFASLSEKATVENVKLSGTVNIEISKDTELVTMPLNGETRDYTNALYGGENKGFTVDGEPSEFITVTVK